ncbi:MAG: hypothetical protein IJW12_02765, partial [Opitutales bacterium]|nr:hypothetical protein [Opitutales bacterium]
MKKLLMAGALSLAASLFANAETLLTLPESVLASKNSQFRGNTDALNILNKSLSWNYGVYAGNNGGASSWEPGEGEWVQDTGTSGNITLAGRNGTQGESFALVLGNEIVVGTMFNSITFEVEIPANGNLDQKTFNLGVGYASNGSFQKTTTTSVTSSSTTSTSQ